MNDDRAQDERLMAAALAFGRRNLGVCAPSPSVGALIMREGALVGRGVTSKGGRPHGEVNALDQAGYSAAGATLYVTLEPCFHQGRAAPCAPAIVAAGIARVVSAMEDPDARVAGRGHALLREAGLEVVVGIGEREARRDHRGHILRVTQGRPMTTLKLARTADGFAAGEEHDPRLAITGEAANLRVQVLRSMHDAIMIGAGTALDDDPLLTVRLAGAPAFKPLRIVLDARLRLSPRSRLAATARVFPTLAIATLAAPIERAERRRVKRRQAGPAERLLRGEQNDLVGEPSRDERRADGRAAFAENPGHAAPTERGERARQIDAALAVGGDALDRDAQGLERLGALEDRARYAEAEIARFGSDEMRRFERLD